MNPVLTRLARSSLPRTDGVLRLDCLEEPVEIVRDRFGIPHVYARSRADLVRAQGFVHAQDRLFQMESVRRFAFGRLSELVGRRTLEADRVARRLLLRRTAEVDAAACDPEAAALAEAYCEGVNAFLERGPLPLELRLLRAHPEPWTPVDVQAPAQMFALVLCGNWENELLRARLAAALGDERLARIDPTYPGDHPLIVPPARVARRAARFRRVLRSRLGTGASNSFVVSGARTASGAPILANDPHLVLGIPSVWHAQHLVWDGGESWGFTIAGAPVVILGRNRRVAWGMTTAMIDTQDLFVERLHPDDPTRYEADGTWLEGEVVREEIRVRGRRAPVVEEVLVTRHGPVVVPAEPGGREALALSWSHHEPGETTRSLLDLMTARSVEDADRALDGFAGPPHNYVLADADGTIAYRLAGGPIPRRRVGSGSVPTPGWDSERDWDGYLSPAELPRFRNPAGGAIVTANNRIAGEGYPHRLPGEYLSGYRAQRLQTLLDANRALTPDAAARILLDRLSLPGLELARIAGGFRTDDALEARALDVLSEWDGDYAAESAGGAVYAALVGALEREALRAACGGEAPDVPLGLFERGRPALLRRLGERDDSLFAGAGGDGAPMTWERVFGRALAAAVADLGADPAAWRRGRFHRLRFAHPLERLPGLRRLVSRGPFPIGGDADTVQVMSPASGMAAGATIGPSMRAVYDLGDPDGTRIALAPGQSGHPGSPHYDDLLAPWLAGEYVPLATDRSHVEELAESRQLLEPARSAE